MTTDSRDPRVRELVYELMQAAPPAPPLPVAAMTEDSPSRARRVRFAAALLVVVIAVVTATLAVIVRHSPSHPGSVIAPSTTAAPEPGTTSAPSVAYVDRRGLVVHAGVSGHDVVVASGSVSTPRWSASGEWLAYRLDNELWVVRADGSKRQHLAGNAGPNYFSDTYAWSPRRDDWLAVLDGRGVRLWSLDGTEARSTEILPPVGGVNASAQSLQWLGGGTSVAIAMQTYAHTGPSAPTSSFWLAAAVCAPATTGMCADPPQFSNLGYAAGRDEYPIFFAGATLGVFDDGYFLIWPDYIGSGSIALDGLPLKAVPIGTGATVTIGTTLVRDAWVQPSPDGVRLLVVRSNGRMVTDNREVDVCDSPTRCHAIAPGPDVQTLDPAWSPDSKRIAFVREEPASFSPPVLPDGGIDWTVKYRTRNLWIADADGSDAHEITAAGGGVADPQFSPDGRSIVFIRDAQVWQLDLATNRLSALSGSMRLNGSCTFGDCLPDAAVYETEARWSDHVAVKFPPKHP